MRWQLLGTPDIDVAYMAGNGRAQVLIPWAGDGALAQGEPAGNVALLETGIYIVSAYVTGLAYAENPAAIVTAYLETPFSDFGSV